MEFRGPGGLHITISKMKGICEEICVKEIDLKCTQFDVISEKVRLGRDIEAVKQPITTSTQEDETKVLGGATVALSIFVFARGWTDAYHIKQFTTCKTQGERVKYAFLLHKRSPKQVQRMLKRPASVSNPIIRMAAGLSVLPLGYFMCCSSMSWK